MIPQIDTKFTVGNIITIGLLLFSMVMAYSKLATKDEIQDVRKDFSNSLDGMKKDYVSREVNTLQLQVLTNQVISVDGKVDEMQRDLKEIKRWVK